MVGSIGVFRQGNIHRQTAELGYYVAEEYWGKGIMTEAVKQICKYVFDNSDIEGTLRSNAVKNGKVIDMKMYSFLKTEVRGSQKKTK